jgi:hypothetical protein
LGSVEEKNRRYDKENKEEIIGGFLNVSIVN